MARNLLLLVVSLLVAVLAAEVALRSRKTLRFIPEPGYVVHSAWWKDRWFRQRKGKNPREFVALDRELGWIPAAGLDGMEYEGATISTNSAHMRGRREFPLERTGAPRVVTVGDSYTFGQCASDDETYPAAIGAALPGSEVLNLGVMGYGQDQALMRLVRDGLPYAPDVVVFGFHGSNKRRNLLTFRDYAKPRFRLDEDGLEPENVPVPTPTQVVFDPWPLRLWDYATMAREKDNMRRPEVRERMDVLSRAIVERMAAETRAAGARLVIVHLPHPAALQGDDYIGWGWLAELCEDGAGRFSCASPVPRFREMLPDEEAVRRHFDCHFSPALYRATGESVAEVLRRELPGVFTGAGAAGPAGDGDA